MNVPFVDIARSEKPLVSRIFSRIRKITSDNSYILGPDVETFESAFAEYLGAKYCVGVASGTDAIGIGLAALGVGPGDEVIGPAMTFISSLTPAHLLGARIVLVDIEKNAPVMDVERLKNAITPKTKAIIAVHLHGVPANMQDIMEIAHAKHIAVIEDACQAAGSTVKLGNISVKAGTAGDFGAFSFYPAKNLGGWGDGGALVTNNSEIAKTAKLLRSHGQEKKNYHTEIGMTGRLDTVQAAVLQEKLKHLDYWNQERRVMAEYYKTKLANLPVEIPKSPQYGLSNYHIFAITLDKRDEAMQYLAARGIETHVHYPSPLHVQPALNFLGYQSAAFPNATKLAQHSLSLPIYPGMRKSEVNYVVSALSDFFNEQK